jgi:GNAT superfamily N-acetyltransferase
VRLHGEHVTVTIRQATVADTSDISALIAESARGLGRADYSDDVIEAALKSVWGLDTQLVADGTYFLAYVDGELAACGGWSFRRTLFGSDHLSSRDDGRLSPGQDAARIRAFFVRPAFARQGLAARVLARCEQEARDAGFLRLTLGATAPGRRLYRALGFVEGEPIDVALGAGLTIQVIPMSKAIAPVLPLETDRLG